MSVSKRIDFSPFLENKFKKMFACFDYDHDGVWTEDDARHIAELAGEKNNLPRKKVQEMSDTYAKLYRQFFNEEGGKSTANDFVRISKTRTEEQIRDATIYFYGHLFDGVDSKKGGEISEEEFLDWCDLANVGRITGRQAFKLIDENHDGKITREEFVDIAVRYKTSNDESDSSKHLYGPWESHQAK